MKLASPIAFAFAVGVTLSFVVTTMAAPPETQSIAFSVKPGVRFLTPSTAEVRWETTIAGPSIVAYGPTRKLGEIAVSENSGTSHRAVLGNLTPGGTYWYRFGLNQDGKRSFSPVYQLDGRMN